MSTGHDEDSIRRAADGILAKANIGHHVGALVRASIVPLLHEVRAGHSLAATLGDGQLPPDSYYSELAEMAQNGERRAALILLIGSAEILQNGLELPPSLRSYLAGVFVDVVYAADPLIEERTTAPLASAVARALNLAAPRGRPADPDQEGVDFVRALRWAERRDAGETYEAALEGAAKESNCDESTIARAVRRYPPCQ